MIRIGCFPYRNIQPLFDTLNGEALWVWNTPRQLVTSILQLPVDLACIPAAAIPQVRHRYTPIVQIGLAATGPVHSVLLISRTPVQRLQHRRVWVTPESITSVALLTVLFRHVWSVDTWQWVDTLSDADAALLIGDTALALAVHRGNLPNTCSPWTERDGRDRWMRVFSPELWPYVYDLGAVWYRWQGLPFVYAVWVVRNDWNRAERTVWVRRWLRHVVTCQAGVHGSGDAETDAYLRRFRYVLTAADRRALHIFLAYLHTNPLEEWTEDAERGRSARTNVRLPFTTVS